MFKLIQQSILNRHKNRHNAQEDQRREISRLTMLAVAETKRKHPRKFQCDKVSLIYKPSIFWSYRIRVEQKFSVIKNSQQIKN